MYPLSRMILEEKKMTFEQWLMCVGKSPKSAKNYSQAISSSINKWAKGAHVIKYSITSIETLNEFVSVSENIKKLSIFLTADAKGNGMYSNAPKHYAAYLDDITGQSLSDDIRSISVEQNISETERAQLMNARLGQGKFRKDLIDYWKRCSVTGVNNLRFLIASHIKPWRKATNRERIDVNNGLLLLPNYDKAFDLGYITFNNEGKILISSYLEQPDGFGIKQDQSVAITEGHRVYLKFHRENVFENFIDATGRQ